MEYSECQPFIPLRDGDKVFCTKVYDDGDTVTLCWLDTGKEVSIGCRQKYRYT
ncbi:unnamed protein product [Laminaria digitata]